MGERVSPTLLRACLSALGWSQGDLARHLGCRIELVQRWARGADGYAVPAGISEWLMALAQQVAGSRLVEEWVSWRDALPTEHPPPEDWRSGRGRAPSA